MAEEAVVIESAATPEQQAAAEKLGWIPPSRFKGEPERFIDAEEYIERGETVLPIVKKQNALLHAEVEQLRGENAKTAAALKSAQGAIDQIEERHTVETQKAVENARKELKAQLASASEAGDHEAVAELTDQMTRLVTAEKEAAPIKKAETPEPPVVTPELKEWNAENPWFGTNKRKTALALAIAQELREAGDVTTGRTFFDKVSAEMEKESPQPRGDKVEGARNGSETEVRQSGKKSYANLPAEAKAACKADAKRFVGEGKRYKTEAEWNSRYAQIYFEES